MQAELLWVLVALINAVVAALNWRNARANASSARVNEEISRLNLDNAQELARQVNKLRDARGVRVTPETPDGEQR